MNFTELLKFIPLIVGGFLAYHLIFKADLPSKGFGGIFTYLFGIIIVFIAVGWLIQTFLPDFANQLLETGQDSAEWTLFINNSETVVNDAFNSTDDGGTTGGTIPQIQPTAVNNTNTNIIIITPTPTFDNDIAIQSAGPSVHTVVPGDTLFGLSRTYGVTIENLRAANGIPGGSNVIHPGEQIIIPAR